ncbi:transcriptional regulator (LysR family) [Klebsiella pneumoniae]|nr:transcriptional regulator (LysR family) [Klebsiella pneumoniae]
MRPVTHLPTCATETAGAGDLKIAETFPEGRGSPHGCGLRAVFCRDAASALPAACRDKSKGPRSGDFAGPSPGVQGAAATGRPLCTPCAIRDRTQKINRERNLPGINIEVVALPNVVVLPNIVRTGTFPVVPLFRWRLRLTRPTGSTGDLCFPGPASAVPEGNLSAPYPPFRRVAATPYPARGSCGLPLIYPLARLKLPVLAASKSLRRSRKAGAARMDAG